MIHWRTVCGTTDTDSRGTSQSRGRAGRLGGVPESSRRDRPRSIDRDAVRCLEDEVLVSLADANVGSLPGIGFPAWTGGVLQYVNG